MEIRLYKNFSDAYKVKTAAAGKPLKESFRNTDLSKYAVIVNGKIKDENYEPQEEDTILLRRIPRGTDYTNPGWWFATILTGGIYNAIDAGCQAYYNKKALEEMEDEMSKKSTTLEDTTNLPYIAGASNTIATGKTQPYILGKHLFTPYVLNAGGYSSSAAAGFHTIGGTNGEKSYYNVLLEAGFNKQVLNKIRAESTVIKSWADDTTTPQEGIYKFDETSDFNDDENIIEIRQEDGQFETAEFQQKIIETKCSDALKKADDDDYEPLVYSLEKYAMAANIVISFAGLLYYDSTYGVKLARTVNVKPEYSLDGGNTWVEFYFNQNGTKSNTFTYNTTKEIRFEAHIDFTYDQVKDLTDAIQVRLSTDTKAFSGTAYDTPTVLYIQSLIYNPEESEEAAAFVKERVIEPTEAALSTIVGIRVKATEKNQSKLTKINLITSGTARTWTGEKWTATKTPTSNLAACVLELLCSDTHRPSKCDITDDTENDEASSEELDLESFGAWYNFCDVNGIEINEVLTDGATKQSVIESLLSIGQATLYNNIYGKIAVAIDQPQTNAIAILNSQNLVSFSWEKDLTRRTDGIKCTFTNAAADYVEDCYLVMRDGKTRDADSQLREETLKGITNQPQVVKYARRLMAIDELRPNIITAEVGQEAVFYTPYAKVLLQHPALKLGLGTGAEIKGVIYNADQTEITGLELFDAVEYDSTNEDGFGVVIQAYKGNGITEIAKAYTATANGRVYKINFVNALPVSELITLPKRGDTLSYGYLNNGKFDTITGAYIINSMEPGEKTVTLQLLDYNESIYDSGTIPAYKPNLTQPRTMATASTQLTLQDLSKAVDGVNDTINSKIATIETLPAGVTVYADTQMAGFYVDADGRTIGKQQLVTQIHAVQAGTEELDFIYGTLPEIDGVHISFDYHTLTIEVDEGTKLENTKITIPIVYRQVTQDYEYTDEFGEVYGDQDGLPYGDFEISSTSKTYNFEFDLVAVKGGSYREGISSLEELAKLTLTRGDYFTWTGDDTETDLAEAGKFEKAATYIYYGIDTDRTWRFKVDDNQEDTMAALSDVLNVLNDEIEANNIRTVTLLNRLVANNIFVKKLAAEEGFIEKLTANDAFITNLMANDLTVGNTIKSANYEENKSGFKLTQDGTIYANKGRFSAGIGNFTTYGAMAFKAAFQHTLSGNSGLIILAAFDTSGTASSKVIKINAIYFYTKVLQRPAGEYRTICITELKEVTSTGCITSYQYIGEYLIPDMDAIITIDVTSLAAGSELDITEIVFN